jgi:hypothetical protein
MDAPTISAFAASVAAIVAATVAGIQLFIGRKQATAALTSAKAALLSAQNAGRHKIAESRQKWIDKVIDTLSEHHSILSPETMEPVPLADSRKIAALRTKLEILLNPKEPETVALLQAMDRRAISVAEQKAKDAEIVAVARRLLKEEWVRIKKELE